MDERTSNAIMGIALAAVFIVFFLSCVKGCELCENTVQKRDALSSQESIKKSRDRKRKIYKRIRTRV